MSNSERKQQIKDLNDAIATYEFMLEDALFRNDKNEVKFLREQIQKSKREKVALKKQIQFALKPEEDLYFKMFGESPCYAANNTSEVKTA